MRTVSAFDRLTHRGPAWALGVVLVSLTLGAMPAPAATIGKIQGKVVSAETGEPLGFADVALLPADTTLHPVGGLTNADGTFLLEAPPGAYALRIRALSYSAKRIANIVIEAGKLLPLSAALTPEAIKQEEIVVEARRKDDTEASLLAARKKATSVGDAVSAEQVRRTPDKDAAEVLRRVTGLSIADGKYVFVRGLGERYSSTEVDGVRIASPEQNKRVVPLDLLPASLLENIVIQKTYTADRPGEFGGGDVQVHTKDFPGNRTWQVSISQGYTEGSTFQHRSTYPATRADIFGFGADARKIPQAVYEVAGGRPLVESIDPHYGFPKSTLAEVGKSFRNVWSSMSDRTIPNAVYSATYGDEFKVFGHPLGVIQSWNLNRSFAQREESDRFFITETDTLYDYAVKRFQESVQLGGISGLSYRISPRHTVHLRGLYTNNADDEVRTYQGPDHNRVESTTGTWLVHRNTRLMYVQRSVLSGTVAGQHEFSHLFGTRLDWKFTRSRATRLQPDRREYTYDRRYSYDANNNLVSRWILGSTGSREYGDLKDNGWGTTLNAALPYRLGPLGSGKLAFGYDRQTKDRSNFYRRFNIYPHANTDRKPPPEQIFDPEKFDGGPESAYVEEATLDIDNYRATQRVEASYVTADVPFGRPIRGTFGVRLESGSQDVRSYDLFNPARITQHGALDNRDVLPSGNLTWAVTDAINLRLGASRTVSRPDLNELSPSPSLEYVGGYQIAGNPNLRRAFIDNYDVRIEAFPGLSEVLAAGYFYKYLREPIEQVIQGGSPPLLVPRNSDHGRNVGVELEARAGLGRLWRRLNGLSVNSNASFISSAVFLDPRTAGLNSTEHVLQGQANYLFNAALSYSSRKGRMDTAVLIGATGKRLMRLAEGPLGNIFEEPSLSLDATINFAALRGSRVKLAGKNLLDPRIRQLQGGQEVSGYRKGRGISLAFSYGS